MLESPQALLHRASLQERTPAADLFEHDDGEHACVLGSCDHALRCPEQERVSHDVVAGLGGHGDDGRADTAKRREELPRLGA